MCRQNNCAMVKSEITKFCENTSVKGIPRVVKSPTKLLRAIWLVTVLLCMSIAFWQTSEIVIEFSGYPVTTTITEKNREEIENENLTDYKSLLTFPTVTVCNTNAFSTNLSQYDGVLTFDDYIEKVNSMFPNSQKGFVQALRTSRAYGAFIGKDAVMKASHKQDNMIVSCQYLANYLIFPPESIIFFSEKRMF